MKSWKKLIAFTVLIFGMTLFVQGEPVSAAKTSKVTMNLVGAKTRYKYPAALKKAKKVTLKSSKKSVVKATYKKSKGIRRIVLTAKKLGTATVTFKCKMKNNTTKIYKYKVSVVKSKKVTAMDKAKRAFKIQNQYRKEKGVTELEWSDELYQFCLYRIKTSGFDGHENLGRDANAYFGLYAKYKPLAFAENMYSGYTDPESAMKSWKNSPGHYSNLLSADHVCGAIARYGNVWCAIFYNGDKSEVENWRNYQIKEITVKRYNSQSDTYASGSKIAYYEEGNQWDSLKAATISQTTGKKIYLEVGKSYVIYERVAPEGCTKAERVTITVTAEGVSEVVLTN